MVVAALIAAAAALFLALPQTDLWFSALFYSPQRGFVLREWAPVVLVYRLVPWLAWGIALVVAIGAGWLFLMRRPLWRLDRKALLFIAFATALGPGLVANTVLKDHWGRARPIQVEAFGGAHHFTAAPLPAAECVRNCSFVSGHAALGFSLVAFAFLLPRGKARRRATAAALGLGALIGLVRIAQGGHFLSDVVWAALLVFATTAALHRWIVERDALAAPPALRFYRRTARAAAAGCRRGWAVPGARSAAATGLAALAVVAAIAFIDQPAVLYLHQTGPDVHALFAQITVLGEAWGWLVLFALGFAGLHWGGVFPGLRPWAARLRAWSAVPAFLFVAIAAAGLVTDILKIGLGRMRPKLLFHGALYGFTGLSWRPDHWSFPSGHTATFVALATALWWLWPRHLLFYILAAAIVAVSRIAVGAHYPSDVIAGALVAVWATRAVAWAFARGGIDIAASRPESALATLPPWPCRYFCRLRARRAGSRACPPGPSLASPRMGVVSPEHGPADRDV